ncbi:PD-(D/E)XK nuclease family protein [Neobacillus cucumis]|uniref:PD-(D/E)XK nuclease family protein n=1 Tax=Neobacillus cucumis TaxID=1740721 RepID=UPI002E249831|nr:PD-(D/E)XK nuclease family protein [Neobacillus cucumis]
MGEIVFSGLKEIASEQRLKDWFEYQSKAPKPLYYLLPSGKWFQSARSLQPGISFQTFDDLALLLLNNAERKFTSITDEDRVLLFYQILNPKNHILSEKELSQKAQAFADSYGQLKRLGLQVKETPEPLRELKESFYTYEKEYRDQQGLYDQENRIYKAVETPSDDFPLSHVVIDGFMDFSPIQYLFIEYLVKNSIPCTIYLPTLDTPLIHETVSTLRSLGLALTEKELPIQEEPCKRTTLTGATTMEEEIYGVLETIAEQKGSQPYSQFGLVLVNQQTYMPELERISAKRQIPLKLAKKKPLEETMVLPFIEQLLDKDEKLSKWEQLSVVDTVAKLCFLSGTEFNQLKETFIRTGQTGRDDIDEFIRTIKQFQVSLPEEETVSTYLNQVLHFLEGLPFPSIWRELMKGRTPAKLKQVALEWRALQFVKQVLNELSDSRVFAESKVPLAIFRTRVMQRLKSESLYLERKPTDVIEVYSLRDVPLFRGEHLFVLGLNEGEFPKQVQLNGYFQERYMEGSSSRFPLPLSDYFRKKDDAAFAQLKYMAEQLSFSFVEGMNPNQPLLPSKYLMEMPNLPAGYSTIAKFTSESYLNEEEYEEKAAYHVGIGKELRESPILLTEYRKNLDYLESGEERVSAKWVEKLLSYSISITRLENYARCSFAFGLEKLLNVQPPLERQRRIDPLETGNMLHRIIEKFYRQAIGQPFNNLHSFFAEKHEKTLAEIFENEWQKVVETHPEIRITSLHKEKEEWWKRLRRWLQAEKFRFWQNEQLTEMTIFRLEEPIRYEVELEDQTILTLTGKIDRIDIDEQGFVIYDYKSSKKELDFNHEVPNGLMLQIPLYLMALEEQFEQGRYQEHHNKQPIGGGYISIKEPHERKKNMVWKDKEQRLRFEPNSRVGTHVRDVDKKSLNNEFNLHGLVERLWRGTFTDFSVRPFNPNSCKYCSFKAICRVTKEQQDS